jgi:hypothetical protein
LAERRPALDISSKHIELHPASVAFSRKREAAAVVLSAAETIR